MIPLLRFLAALFTCYLLYHLGADAILAALGAPLAALQGLDDGERVIYVGTLNKALFPGLRLGYAVVPNALLPEFVRTRYLADRQPSADGRLVATEPTAFSGFHQVILGPPTNRTDWFAVNVDPLESNLAFCKWISVTPSGWSTRSCAWG